MTLSFCLINSTEGSSYGKDEECASFVAFDFCLGFCDGDDDDDNLDDFDVGVFD
eukprot:CAMPEP_0204635888 /NCGR_PEP_ID=MMETSP0717-20131115/32595_1 /ASSEMBLY_ACC=CAM_ASM_000666 /TAXON_ID=230516 /ORGANISM="Chaetoceros curvisetus" /LENGTH=53 /DNA_ID=CAMNT_0051654793 /DNA_START=309 /DNA_END=470 /DNA_ORIENTATION=+